MLVLEESSLSTVLNLYIRSRIKWKSKWLQQSLWHTQLTIKNDKVLDASTYVPKGAPALQNHIGKGTVHFFLCIFLIIHLAQFLVYTHPRLHWDGPRLSQATLCLWRPRFLEWWVLCFQLSTLSTTINSSWPTSKTRMPLQWVLQYAWMSWMDYTWAGRE